MKRKLKPEQHEEIVRAIAAGDRVKATSIYLSATESNLTEAQNFIKTIVVKRKQRSLTDRQKIVADPMQISTYRSTTVAIFVFTCAG